MIKIEGIDQEAQFKKVCNKNQKCEYSVFKASLQPLDELDMGKACLMSYNVIDRDMSNSISIKEFVNFVELQKLDISMDQIIELFNSLKIDEMIEYNTYKTEFEKHFDIK